MPVAFNDKVDKITMTELAESLQDAILNAGTNAINRVNRHMNDSAVHVSSAEKIAWNNKAPNTSPAFTGTPTAPTPDQKTNNDQIATTRFVTRKVNSYRPQFSESAGSLATAHDFNIIGAIRSNTVSFDGTDDVSLNVQELGAQYLKGTVPVETLKGTYNISITGTAQRALSADLVAGLDASNLAPLNSPVFTGIPAVPTAPTGDKSTTIANTKFVADAIARIEISNVVDGARSLVNKPTITLKGKVTSDPVEFNGKDSVEITIKDIDIAEKLRNVSVSSINGFTVNANVPADAKFTDTIYEHPKTKTDLSGTPYLQVVLDPMGHAIAAYNPETIDVGITGNAGTATRLKDTINITHTGITVEPVITNFSSDFVFEVTAVPAGIVTEDANHRFFTDRERNKLQNTMTSSEVEAALSAATTTGMVWKEAADSFTDITTKYPNPKEGWVVETKDTGDIYRYDAQTKKWVGISSNSLPLVTHTTDGKMSKEDKVKLDGIEANANNYVLPETLPAGMIIEDNDHKFINNELLDKLNNAMTKTEADAKYRSKLDNAIENLKLGGSWEFKPNTDGNLDFLYNGTVKATVGTDGSFLSKQLKEVDTENPSKVTSKSGPVKIVADYDGLKALKSDLNIGEFILIKNYHQLAIYIGEDKWYIGNNFNPTDTLSLSDILMRGN